MTDFVKVFSPYKTYRVVDIDEFTQQVWGYGDIAPSAVTHDPDVAAAKCKQFEIAARNEFMQGWGKKKVVHLNTKGE